MPWGSGPIRRRARMRICWKLFGGYPPWPGYGRGMGWGRGWGFQNFGPQGSGGPGPGGIWLIEGTPAQMSEKIEVKVKDLKKKAKEILKGATIGPANPWNWLYPIIKDGRVVGYLWEIVPLDKVEIGGVHEVAGEKRVALIYDDRVVGYVIV